MKILSNSTTAALLPKQYLKADVNCANALLMLYLYQHSIEIKVKAAPEQGGSQTRTEINNKTITTKAPFSNTM